MSVSLSELRSYLPYQCYPGVSERGRTHELAAEETAAERAVRDERDAELLTCVPDPDLRILNVKREGCILKLRSRDGVHGVCAPQGVL